jgi:hypothetical protein
MFITGKKIRRPKSEGRKKSKIRNPNLKPAVARRPESVVLERLSNNYLPHPPGCPIRIFGFGLLSDFGIRSSDLSVSTLGPAKNVEAPEKFAGEPGKSLVLVIHATKGAALPAF